MSSGFSLWKCASTAAMLRATICSAVRVLVTTLSLVLAGVRALTLGGICDNSKACLATKVQRPLNRQPGAYARRAGHAKSDFEAREGVKLSFLPFFARAAIEALKVHPSVNSSIDQDAGTVTYHDTENLGIAVDTERGLLPVIHEAGDLSIGGIARKIADLQERTRTNKITADELAGGTFTLTNTGSRGALFDTPIINQPQVAILGVKRPAVVQDSDLGEVFAIRSMVYLALTYDHRTVMTVPR